MTSAASSARQGRRTGGAVLDRAVRHTNWDQAQRSYWSSIATIYDSLYESSWSKLENAYVLQRLSFLEELRSPCILDLGCGTGLGAEMVGTFTTLSNYTGVDISPEMTAIASRRMGVETRTCAMDALDWVPSDSVDVVIALFGSASFAESFPGLLADISRVLRPGGCTYLSALGRGGGTKTHAFRTRGDKTNFPSVQARRFRVQDLETHARAAGLVNTTTCGMNFLAGIAEIPLLWPTGRLLARQWPNGCHLIELFGQIPGQEIQDRRI